MADDEYELEDGEISEEREARDRAIASLRLRNRRRQAMRQIITRRDELIPQLVNPNDEIIPGIYMANSIGQFLEEIMFSGINESPLYNRISNFTVKGSLQVLWDVKFYITFITIVCLFPDLIERFSFGVILALAGAVSMLDDLSPEVVNMQKAQAIIARFKRKFGEVSVACSKEVENREYYKFLTTEYAKHFAYAGGILGLLGVGWSLTYLTYIQQGNFTPPLIVPIGQFAASAASISYFVGCKIVGYAGAAGSLTASTLISLDLASFSILLIAMLVFKLGYYLAIKQTPDEGLLSNMKTIDMFNEITGDVKVGGIKSIGLIAHGGKVAVNSSVASFNEYVATFYNNQRLRKIIGLWREMTVFFTIIISYSLFMNSSGNNLLQDAAAFGNRKPRTGRTSRKPYPKYRSSPTHRSSPKHMSSPARKPSPKRRSPKKRVSSNQFYYM